MPKVLLVTTWDERCGIAEYAKNLLANCPGVELDIHARPFEVNSIERAAEPYQIVHFNHEPGLFRHIEPSLLTRLRRAGKKVVTTWHASCESSNKNSWTSACDAVVVHEKTQDGFRHIPMGIPDGPRSPSQQWNSPLIGTAGFPFSWKGTVLVAEAAAVLHLKPVVIIPQSGHIDVSASKKEIEKACHGAVVITDWLSQDAVLVRLGICLVTVFPYGGGNAGISGAVRLGLGTGRPCIISLCRQFRDLLEGYRDELYVVDSEWPTKEQLIATLRQVTSDCRSRQMKFPKRLLEDMSWKKCGEMYRALYGELVGE